VTGFVREAAAMTDDPPTRRTAALSLAAASAMSALTAAFAQTGDTMSNDADLAQHAHDWDWLAGSWNVRHRRLNGRLVGSTEWQEFNGTCRMVPTLAGFGNMDDNWLDIPSGAYRAMGVRGFNRETRQWSIWWYDERFPTAIGEPVRGGFADGVGIFGGDDEHNGQPIKVRFMWSEITANSARWQQAFSADGGATWEVNWVMHFTRA
jgi:hypothetical protein